MGRQQILQQIIAAPRRQAVACRAGQIARMPRSENHHRAAGGLGNVFRRSIVQKDERAVRWNGGRQCASAVVFPEPQSPTISITPVDPVRQSAKTSSKGITSWVSGEITRGLTVHRTG